MKTCNVEVREGIVAAKSNDTVPALHLKIATLSFLLPAVNDRRLLAAWILLAIHPWSRLTTPTQRE